MSIKVVYRKDRDKWQVTYWIEGKRKRPLFDKETEARNFAKRLKSNAPEKDSITIDKAIQSYYGEVTQKRKGRVSQTTDKRYFNLLFHFMTEERGLANFASIQLQDLEAFQMWLLEQTSYDGKPMRMGPASVNRAFNSIRHLFKKHVQWQNLESSPCIYLDRLPSEEKPRRALSSEEFFKALAVAPVWYRPAFTFIYLTGSPPVCIERLTWADVDFSAGTFVTLRKKGREAKLKRTTLPMPEAVRILLMAQIGRHASAVFVNEYGRPLTADRTSKVGCKAIREAGLEDAVLYGLRHGLATDLTEANVATEIVKQALGHASITTTQRYTKRLKTETLSNALTLVRGELVADKCHQNENALPAGDTAVTA